MPSKFPGMDPFIEGQAWHDFHQDMIMESKRALIPQLRPRYIARVEKYVYLEHVYDDLPQRISPDITVVQEPVSRKEAYGSTAVTDAPVTIPLPMAEEARAWYIEIRLRETGEIITVIEVLSPINKHLHSGGRREYLEKRDAIIYSSVHLVELDLLRGGERLPMALPLPEADYYAIVRSYKRPLAGVWHCVLQSPLPEIPIPLAGKDPDAKLNLQVVFNTVYDLGGYDYLLDYTRLVEPSPSAKDADWVKTILGSEK